MNRIYLPTLEQNEPAHAAQQRNQRGLKITIFHSDNQSALKLVERQARRLRSAEALVTDRRRALDEEITIALDTTPATLSDIERAAGKSAHDAIERMHARRKQPL